MSYFKKIKSFFFGKPPSSKKNKAASNTLKHLAIIMDGNGRWAKQQSKPRIFGHQQGVKVTEDIIEHCRNIGIAHLSLYAFSSQNWQRPKNEVNHLMQLLDMFLKSKIKKMQDNAIEFHAIGNVADLPKHIQTLIAKTQSKTKIKQAETDFMTLNLALSYGGREEIISAIKTIAQEIQQNKISPSDIDQGMLKQYMHTKHLPDPDLIIRTGGEYRTSNFLTWQSIYSEYSFSSTLWPDFKTQELDSIITNFHQRHRRYGKES